jgi:hypothetical protein
MNEALICPLCGSQQVARILYGMPAFNEDLERNLRIGKWVLGGCSVWKGMPETICLECNPESADRNYQKELDTRPGFVS